MDQASLQMARQPILDRERQIMGYEFFFRDNEGKCDFTDPRATTASVLVSLLNQVGLDASAGEATVFVNIDSSILLTDLLLSTPVERFVFEIAATAPLGSREREMLQTYHVQGYRFAFTNVTTADGIHKSLIPILPYIDYVKFDTTACDLDALPKCLEQFKGKKLIAERVEIPEVFDAYQAMGFDYFQGYFFARPSLIRHNRVDPKHLGVIRIYNMLLNETPIEQVAREFEKHNELTLQLLQYLNSTSMSDAFPNRSVEEILKKFGAKRLQNWLLMIIYSKSSRTIETAKSPLSKLIEQRIDLMSYIIKTLSSANEKKLTEQARLTAFLSLMEPVLNVPMKTLLEHVRPDQVIEDALIAHAGKLGKIYALALAVEHNDSASARQLVSELKLREDILQTLRNMKKI